VTAELHVVPDDENNQNQLSITFEAKKAELPVKARALADKVRSGIEDLAPALIALWEGSLWRALRDADGGNAYPTWAAMCKAEFHGVTITLPKDQRQRIVREFLVELGMAMRAIAATLDVDEGTVRNDVKQLRRDSAVVVPAKSTGQDGRVRKSTRARRVRKGTSSAPVKVKVTVIDPEPAVIHKVVAVIDDVKPAPIRSEDLAAYEAITPLWVALREDGIPVGALAKAMVKSFSMSPDLLVDLVEEIEVALAIERGGSVLP
jgi:DNA-binding Lrp family transcriptional regulator